MSRLLVCAALLLLGAVSARAATGSYSSGSIAAPIPDGGVLERAIEVPDAGPVAHVAVSLRIAHPRDSDLTISLIGPDGTAVTLERRRGGTGADFGAGPQSCQGRRTVFADPFDQPVAEASAPFVDHETYGPEESLTAFRGTEARGSWRLRIEDGAAGENGTLACWGLVISRDVTEVARASRAAVHAALSFKEDSGFNYRDARLRITRGAATRLDIPVRRLTGARLVRLFVRDLDADGEPEVILDLNTVGAHCCSLSLVYRYDPRTRRYAGAFRDWGNPGYRLADLDRDGRPELISADDRFAYRFTSFAGSAEPTQIWQFDHGRFLDVTHDFPHLTEREAASLWRGYLAVRKEHGDVRGALAAWQADMDLLGREDEGWARLAAAYRAGDLGPRADLGGWPQGQAYLRALRAFLHNAGYAGH
jgi:subtilisin-like proprotein convertase family protein